MDTIKTQLLELLERGDLMRAALTIGKVQDCSLSMEIYAERILEMSSRVWSRSSRVKYDPIYKLQAINQVLFQEEGIVGKHEKYKHVIDDPTRHYLHMVLDKHVASPLALTILYAIIADQVGVEYEVISLPAYFFLRVVDVTGDIYVDPFDHGRILNQEEFQKRLKTSLSRNRLLHTNLFEKVDAYHLVGRLAQQMKHIYILKGNAVEALRAVEILTALFPNSPEHLRDRGILYCEMEYFSKAMDDLRFYIKHRPKADDVGEIRKLTSMLKGYREIVN